MNIIRDRKHYKKKKIKNAKIVVLSKLVKFQIYDCIFGSQISANNVTTPLKKTGNLKVKNETKVNKFP